MVLDGPPHFPDVASSPADGWDRSCVESVADPVHDVWVGGGPVLRSGSDGQVGSGGFGASELCDLFRTGAVAGVATALSVLHVGVVAVVGQLRRHKHLTANPETTRAWQDRSRRNNPLRSMSHRTADRMSERQDAVARAMRRDGYRCQARDLVLDVACWGPLDGHEPLTRARGGDPYDVNQIVTVCRGHHEWIDREQDKAHALGLLRHSWEGPLER